MSFGKEKRLLLGLLALLAPLPLPFNDVLAWPVMLLFAAIVGAFLRRAWRDPGSWLPSWAMNLLGLAYLPILYFDLVVRWSGQLVRPVIHLALFAVAVKLFALRQERDKWHVVIGAFFLFLAAMGTSVHPSILIYLAVFLGLAIATLARFAYYSVLARFGYRQEEPVRAPLRGFVVGATIATFVLGAPLFALLPRIRTPYLLVRGTGTGTVVHAAGFSDLITLDSIGSARVGRQVVMRLRFSPQPRPRREIRIKADTYDRYDGRTWRANGNFRPMAPERGGTFRLGPGAPRQQAEVWLLPWGSPSLPIPVQAVGVLVRVPAISRDRGGALALYHVPGTTLRYDVELGDDPVLQDLPEPNLTSGGESSLDARAVTPRIAALAAQVMGQGDPLLRVQRLEHHLATSYEYTTDFVGRSGQLALEDFLFRTRRGHCEFFATAMVVMLRSQGIPARFVTGFLGGEENAFEGYYIVRQSNAHAWVEAWAPGFGWSVFDPTPASGRPGVAERDLPLLFSEVWDFVQFRWDRYVLTFGFQDQLSLLLQVRSAWLSFWKVFQRNQGAPDLATPSVDTLPGGPVTSTDQSYSWRRWRLSAALLLLGAALAVAGRALWQRQRRRRTATEAYRRLRQRLERSGLPVPASLAPLHLVRAASGRFPAAAAPTVRLVDLYLRESFAAEELDEAALGEAAGALREVEQVLKKAG
jgi:transglutaminase-like putative cysteine protease